jgi:hypothetical protein
MRYSADLPRCICARCLVLPAAYPTHWRCVGPALRCAVRGTDRRLEAVEVILPVRAQGMLLGGVVAEACRVWGARSAGEVTEPSAGGARGLRWGSAQSRRPVRTDGRTDGRREGGSHARTSIAGISRESPAALCRMICRICGAFAPAAPSMIQYPRVLRSGQTITLCDTMAPNW